MLVQTQEGHGRKKVKLTPKRHSQSFHILSAIRTPKRGLILCLGYSRSDTLHTTQYNNKMDDKKWKTEPSGPHNPNHHANCSELCTHVTTSLAVFITLPFTYRHPSPYSILLSFFSHHYLFNSFYHFKTLLQFNF